MEFKIFIDTNYSILLSDLVIYSRENLTKTCFEVLSDFKNLQCVDVQMTKERFLCCVELSRKTNLTIELIKILSGRREQCKREEKPELNTYHRILVYEARLHNKKETKLSSRDLRKVINDHCSKKQIYEPQNLSVEEFILLIRLSQKIPLTAEEIIVTIDNLNKSLSSFPKTGNNRRRYKVSPKKPEVNYQ